MPVIRPEQPADIEAVNALLLAAFGRQAEARLVDRLRASGKIAKALVAEETSRVLGHVVFSKIVAASERGELEALALAPLAVEPAFQRLGIGSALVSAGLEHCRIERQAGIVVLGDPAFYLRFGFVPAARFGLQCPFPAAANAFMAIELQPGALSAMSGAVRYGPEFEDLEESALNATPR
jgi:putative acetyltransferase